MQEITRLTQLQRQLFACVGAFGCVLPINTGSADREVTAAPGATCLSAHPGASALTRAESPLMPDGWLTHA